MLFKSTLSFCWIKTLDEFRENLLIELPQWDACHGTVSSTDTFKWLNLRTANSWPGEKGTICKKIPTFLRSWNSVCSTCRIPRKRFKVFVCSLQMREESVSDAAVSKLSQSRLCFLIMLRVGRPGTKKKEAGTLCQRGDAFSQIAVSSKEV